MSDAPEVDTSKLSDPDVLESFQRALVKAETYSVSAYAIVIVTPSSDIATISHGGQKRFTLIGGIANLIHDLNCQVSEDNDDD